ncbi:MAG: Zn-ribbon domain-containing OB-fold protein [Ilumatobacteraceae bacterium]
MSELPVRRPHRTLETEPFWDGCAARRIVLPQCNACDEVIWYPRRFCPFCGSRDVRWEEMSGRGTIYSFTVIRKGPGPYREHSPYVVAYVELDEGPRLLTNVVDVPIDQVEVGQAVRVVFDAVPDSDDALPRFAPA